MVLNFVPIWTKILSIIWKLELVTGHLSSIFLTMKFVSLTDGLSKQDNPKRSTNLSMDQVYNQFDAKVGHLKIHK